jgi:predicted SAM-dependent methyltransferase
MLRLNLGAGDELLEGFVNHDLKKHRPEIDVYGDLNMTPWEWWADDLFCEVQAISVLEHLKLTLIESFDELHRIVAPGGLVKIKFPIETSPFIRWDPTHRWTWAPESLDFLDPTTRLGKVYHYYTDLKWEIVKRTVGPKKRNCWAELRPRKGT